jgi:hypothetical protein
VFDAWYRQCAELDIKDVRPIRSGDDAVHALTSHQLATTAEDSLTGV